MNRLRALAWKEWRENAVFFWVALGIFLGLPLAGGVEYFLSGPGHHLQIAVRPLVAGFGGVLAIFVAVGATCRDLHSDIEDFWRSRAISVLQWMLVKFWVGLAVVFAALTIPLVTQYALDRGDWDSGKWFISLSAGWCLFYTLGFLAGCLLRKVAPALVATLTTLILIYLLPEVFPPLRIYPGNILAPGDAPSTRILSLSVALLILAMVATQRRWKIEPDPRFMYGSIGATLLILFASLGYRLGTNLPILQQFNLEPGEYIDSLYMNGTRGFAFSAANVRALELTPQGLRVGAPYSLRGNYWADIVHRTNAVRRGNVEYLLLSHHASLVLQVVDFSKDIRGSIVYSRPLTIKAPPNPSGIYPILILSSNRLYIIAKNSATLDIRNPLHPRVMDLGPLDYPRGANDSPVQYWDTDLTLVFHLPAVPGMPWIDRLRVAMKMNWSTSEAVFDGKTLCFCQGWTVVEYRLTGLTAQSGTFKLIGSRRPLQLNLLPTWKWFEDLEMQNNLLYLSFKHGGELNPSVSVYDIHARPRLIGHFAANSQGLVVAPVSDGRAIVAGSKIWLVGRPGNNFE